MKVKEFDEKFNDSLKTMIDYVSSYIGDMEVSHFLFCFFIILFSVFSIFSLYSHYKEKENESYDI